MDMLPCWVWVSPESETKEWNPHQKEKKVFSRIGLTA